MEEKQCLQPESEKAFISKQSSDTKTEEKVEGPDGAHSWVVALAACMINFIMAGLGRMSGILFVAFIEIFAVDRKTASMPFSIRSSARNLFGPVVGILGQKYGCRKVIVAGGILGTLSSAACFFAPDMTWISVLWGGVNGLGSALTVTLPQVVISQYFDKHQTTASGLAFSGGCVGSFVFPVLLEYLLHTYGISGTFLIVGAIIMHTIPAALILKKPPWLKNEAVHEEIQSPSKTEYLDGLLKDESNEVVHKKVKMSTISLSTPQKSTPKIPKREIFKDSPLASTIKRMSIRSVNECTPKKNTPKTALKTSEVYPNIVLLRENEGIVLKLLDINESNEDVDDVFGPEINQNEICFMDEVENLCNSLRCNKFSQFHRNIQRAERDLLGSENETSSFIKNEFRSFHSEKGTPKMEIQRFYSVSDIPRVTSDETKKYILDKLSLLECMDEKKIAELFGSDKEQALQVFEELLKLNKLCPRITKVPQISEEKSSLIAKESELDEVKKPKSDSFLELIKTAFTVYLNPLFVMVCMCRVVHFITFIPAMTTVVDFTMDKGLPEEDGKYAIAAISLGDLLGRLCLGWITDRRYMTLPKYMMLIMVFQGFSTASLPMMETKATIFAGLALFGMLQGSLFVRHPVLVSKYVKANEQSIAMGCVNFFSGLLGFGLPVYIGYFRDTMGSYDCIFYVNGTLGAFVGLLWATEPLFVRYVNSKRTADEKIED